MTTPGRALLYVSRKMIPAGTDAATVAEMVDAAREKNARLDITGALVATKAHFAQILEGPADALSDLMDTICRDTRHADVMILREWALIVRTFASWSLAYSGPSSYMAGHMEKLVHMPPGDPTGQIDKVITLMTGLAAKP